MPKVPIVVLCNDSNASENVYISIELQAKTSQIMCGLINLLKLPAKNINGQNYYYGLRLEQNKALYPEPFTLTEVHLLRGDLIIIEPTILWEDIVNEFPDVPGSNDPNSYELENRLNHLSTKMWILHELAQLLEDPNRQYPVPCWLTPKTFAVQDFGQERKVYLRYTAENESSHFFLSPEQREQPTIQPTIAQYIFSLGVILYQATLGNLPPEIQLSSDIRRIESETVMRFRGLGYPLSHILFAAMFPDKMNRKPNQISLLVNNFELALHRWQACRKAYYDAIRLASLNQFDLALGAYNQVDVDYYSAWNMTEGIIQTADKLVDQEGFQTRPHNVGPDQLDILLERLEEAIVNDATVPREIKQSIAINTCCAEIGKLVKYRLARRQLFSGKSSIITRAINPLNELRDFNYKDAKQLSDRVGDMIRKADESRGKNRAD